MPQYKHPCPHCGNFIMRDVTVCPYCGTGDPFAPGRCPSCRAVIEDPKWVACPKCGQSLVSQPSPATRPAAPVAGSGAAPQPASGSAGSSGGSCSTCGAGLAAGSRFCAVCGTLVG